MTTNKDMQEKYFTDRPTKVISNRQVDRAAFSNAFIGLLPGRYYLEDSTSFRG